MKDFNLEEAKDGAAVCTRDKKKARIICFDRKHYLTGKFQLVVLLMLEDGNESLETFTLDGKWLTTAETSYDLFMAPVKVERWVNVYRDNFTRTANVYLSKELADSCSESDRIACCKIEYEV